MRLPEGLWSVDALGFAPAEFFQSPFRLHQPQPFNVFLNTGVEGGNQTLRKLHPISQRKSHGVSRNFFKGCMHYRPLLTMM